MTKRSNYTGWEVSHLGRPYVALLHKRYGGGRHDLYVERTLAGYIQQLEGLEPAHYEWVCYRSGFKDGKIWQEKIGTERTWRRARRVVEDAVLRQLISEGRTA